MTLINKGTPPQTGSLRLEESMGKICDRYCKYPPRVIKPEELAFRCERCPLNEIAAYVDELRGKFDC